MSAAPTAATVAGELRALAPLFRDTRYRRHPDQVLDVVERATAQARVSHGPARRWVGFLEELTGELRAGLGVYRPKVVARHLEHVASLLDGGVP